MSKIFTKLSNFAIWGYTAFGVLVWVFNQFGVDILAIIENSTVNAEFYGMTGGLLGIAKTAQIVIKTVLTKYETRISAQQQMFLQSLSKVLEGMSLISEGQKVDKQFLESIITQLNLQIDFSKILAEKNLQSVILKDEQILQLNNFIKQSEMIK